jgi:predicted RNase H-like HicB family nuclease
MSTLNVTIELWKQGKYFVTFCPELSLFSRKKTEEEAKKTLIDTAQNLFKKLCDEKALDIFLKYTGMEKIPPDLKENKSLIRIEETILKA